MTDFEREHTLPDIDARIDGELLGTYADLSARFDLEGPELGFGVVKTLLQHIHRRAEPAAYVEFLDKVVEILTEQSRMLKGVISEDCRRRAN